MMWEKRKLNKMLAYSFLFLFLFIIQSSFLSSFKIFNQNIDLIFSFVIAVSMFEEIEFGSVFGFVSGVFTDIFSKTTGFYALFYMFFGLAIALITMYIIRCNFKTFMIVLPCSVLIFSCLSYFFLYAMWGNGNLKFFLINMLIQKIIVVSVTSFWIFFVVKKVHLKCPEDE